MSQYANHVAPSIAETRDFPNFEPSPADQLEAAYHLTLLDALSLPLTERIALRDRLAASIEASQADPSMRWFEIQPLCSSRMRICVGTVAELVDHLALAISEYGMVELRWADAEGHDRVRVYTQSNLDLHAPLDFASSGTASEDDDTVLDLPF